ncbi:SMP-30/gluconolactonase/LRE family protein [Serratia sp. PF2-63]|uniref:SMP-30/gluconolactonase/LRE family protein n=1 Tax=unclassified Serratia (in: enterobacteria) TaxID=2647522 RepID=UPI0024AFE1FC|nr:MULTISPECIES: SMP-30/gluconolactonase/LRE family protein [unclassified Serratia (in: enterobacteria)]EMB6252934.1 SMP-30/gluconolactonase/LRE family protein [Serratia marcescens]MDI6974287.1 SMP-30/gluconolactonase/LRE family protein [Serratia sp. Se-RSBMAAmG]MDI9262581.1 SMP-30/gluconolactonase/LRE family protein [Serratia sp. PF2-63]MDI9270928.1 SMP-30/gluconolactonase/LRE family protein [Serratia sp. PF-27]
MMRRDNPLKNWTLSCDAIYHVGHDLQRPECVLAEPDGTLWVADARGGVMRVGKDGTQQLIAQTVSGQFASAQDTKARLLHGTLPNGLAFDANGDFLIANFGSDVLEFMSRDGRTRTLYDNIDGKPIGKVNFVTRDTKNRLWISVSTRVNPWSDAVCSTLSDGFVALADERGLRIVADGFAFTNEVRLDADEAYLYVAETTANRVSRLRIESDGSLSAREIYGPSDLGPGLIDGIAFDAFGNLWGAMCLSDRLVAITPEGDLLTLFDDGDPEATRRFQAEFNTGRPVSFDTMAACVGTVAPWMASITFSGPDLRTVCIGSLRGTTIPCFTAPVAGLPLVHWNERQLCQRQTGRTS